MDLFSQAEHDELAQAILLSRAPLSGRGGSEIRKLLRNAEADDHRRLARRARRADPHAQPRRGLRDLEPHRARALELSVANPRALLPRLRHAGAIFLGRWSSEAIGDYCAGPNHVLPTSGTARFSSPLGVYDFQKRSSLIGVSRAGARTLGRLAATLARAKGWTRTPGRRHAAGDAAMSSASKVIRPEIQAMHAYRYPMRPGW
jgi:histidinol dehydrogenase